VAKDQYVPIDQEELSAIRPQNDQSIEIDTFIPMNKLDDRFLTERSYFLVPDGKIAQKAYALVRKTLEEGQLRAIAEVILSNREQHVVVRPLGKLLMMTVLQHQQELKKPETYENEVSDVEITKPEMQLTKQLVDGLTREKWSFEEYVDEYQVRLGELIAAKVEGKELVKSPETEAPTIINLMDALKASLKQIPGGVASTRKSAAKPAVKEAAEVLPEATSKPRHKVAASKPRSNSKTKPASRKTG
ncbi:MAG TPA: Ku protein, partial [Pirellula sp.]|nr:Ku protein [Pirellula sp.]